MLACFAFFHDDEKHIGEHLIKKRDGIKFFMDTFTAITVMDSHSFSVTHRVCVCVFVIESKQRKPRTIQASSLSLVR